MDKFDRINLIFECLKIQQNKTGLVDEDLKLISEAEYREFEGGFRNFLRRGIIGAATATAASYGGSAAMKRAGGGTGMQNVASVAAAAASLPIGLYLSRMYKMKTDKCVQACGRDRLCYNKCYLDACDTNIQRIQHDIGEISSLPGNEPHENVAHRKLLQQLRFYQQKRLFFLKRLQKVAPKYEKFKEPSPEADIY